MSDTGSQSKDAEPGFVCDDNLGKLARYLRAGGFDTVFEQEIDNSRLIQISLDEKRHILTRDTKLIERRLVRYYFFIQHDRWQDQLKSVIDHFGLVFSRSNLFTRCLEDNSLTLDIAKERIQDRVWPYTYAHHDNFRECPTCGRIYWSGSHVRAMIDRLEKAGIRFAP